MDEELKMTAKRNGHTKSRLPAIPVDMPGRYTVGNVMAIANWSHTTLYARIKAKRFPAPQKDGKINYWTTDVVRKALNL